MDSGQQPDWRARIYGPEWRAWKDPDVPETFNPTTLLLDKHLGTPAADKCALAVDDADYSYADLLAHVCRAAHGLVALGLRAEDRILLFGTDSLEFVAVWLGAVRAGIVPVVISDQYKAANLRYFLDDTAARALFIDAEQLAKLDEIAAGLPRTLEHIVVRGAARGTAVAYDAMVAGKPATFEPLPRHRNDIAYMFYSGGTTGTAKGITHLAHDFPLIPERHGAFWEYHAGDVVHATSKKYFTHGLWPGVLIPLYWGATAVISRLPPTPDNVIRIVETRRATKLVTVPTIVKNMMLFVEETGHTPMFDSCGLIITASEKMPPEIFEKFRATFGTELHDSIGSSEITYEWIANRAKEYKRGSLGKPVFGFEAKLMDPDGNEVTEPGREGEAWIKSVTACFFYWRKYDRTKETFVGPWTRTGDTLYFDEDGFFWFAGRSDDVFKVKGLWVSPIEVEAAITEHPAVLEAAVISVEDTDGLTKPKAFVVLRPGHAASDALAAALKENVRKVGGYKVPDDIAFVDALPRTTLLKIDRRTLREQERARRGK